jgi:hypothetical protein
MASDLEENGSQEQPMLDGIMQQRNIRAVNIFASIFDSVEVSRTIVFSIYGRTFASRTFVRNHIKRIQLNVRLFIDSRTCSSIYGL